MDYDNSINALEGVVCWSFAETSVASLVTSCRGALQELSMEKSNNIYFCTTFRVPRLPLLLFSALSIYLILPFLV